MNTKELIHENDLRNEALYAPYNPYTGVGSLIPRFEFHIDDETIILLPNSMKEVIAEFQSPGKSMRDMTKAQFATMYGVLTNLRINYDFEFWAATCVFIQDKITKQDVNFILRIPQRILLKVLIELFWAKVPIRIILLKARQWGGSTLVQMFIAWLQIFHFENWHSAIVGDVEEQARTIRGMYRRMAILHPPQVQPITFSSFERSTKNLILNERGCIISIGSMQRPEGLRASDVMCTHKSECASWKETMGKKPEDLIQSLSGMPLVHGTVDVEESTAKGIGNYFHKSWLQAVNKESDRIPVFIPWFKIDMYQRPFFSETEKIEFVEHMDNYSNFLWEEGATLEGINWYYWKRRHEGWDAVQDHWRMMAEYPTTCIARGMKVGTDIGLIPIEDAYESNYSEFGKVLDHISNGKRQVYKLKTAMGYTLRCTEDHRIMTLSGKWKELRDLQEGDSIALSEPMLAKGQYTFKYKDNGFVDISIAITPDFARFVGIFMGDGSYHAQTLSIACDAKDDDFVIEVQRLVKSIFDLDMIPRKTGPNKGCTELRVSNQRLSKYFLQLGIVEQYEEHGVKGSRGSFHRKVCVPGFILRSPKSVIKEFLSGIFETDGFNAFQVPKVEIFSKHIEFLKDLQLLLLAFGITSKIRSSNKINGEGRTYLGNKLTLQGEQASLFRERIGFLSSRKQGMFASWQVRNYVKRTKNILFDSVISIEEDGIDDVYDLTIRDSHKFSANGIVVHNCNEAFQSTGRRAFSPLYVKNAGRYVCKPEFVGEVFAGSTSGEKALTHIRFEPTPNGNLYIWEMPDTEKIYKNRYVVGIDIGGRSVGADYSVIRVLDRLPLLEGGKPIFILTWKGHLDQDLVVWKGTQIAKAYGNGLLVPETNSLDKIESEGDHFLTVLNEIVDVYPHIYCRTSPEQISQGAPKQYGFHVGHNKTAMIDYYNAQLRDCAFIELDQRAVNENDSYEIKANGSYGAVDSMHDDILMPTAEILYISKDLPLPTEIIRAKNKVTKKVINEASF